MIVTKKLILSRTESANTMSNTKISEKEGSTSYAFTLDMKAFICLSRSFVVLGIISLISSMERILSSKIFKFRRSTVDFLALIALLFSYLARYLEVGNSLKRK